MLENVNLITVHLMILLALEIVYKGTKINKTISAKKSLGFFYNNYFIIFLRRLIEFPFCIIGAYSLLVDKTDL